MAPHTRVWSGAVNRRITGGTLWVASGMTLPVELIAGSATRPRHSWAHDTISELGRITCGPASCSPLHDAVNLALVVTGACLAVGGILLAPWLASGVARGVVVACSVITGLSTAATGAVPLDVDPPLHFLVSAPALALAGIPPLLTVPRRITSRAVRLFVYAVTVAGVIAGAAVSVWVEAPTPGLLERLAVWPSTVLLCWLGWVLTRPDGGRPTEPLGAPGPSGTAPTGGESRP